MKMIHTNEPNLEFRRIQTRFVGFRSHSYLYKLPSVWLRMLGFCAILLLFAIESVPPVAVSIIIV